jgi:hypothetical protein
MPVDAEDDSACDVVCSQGCKAVADSALKPYVACKVCRLHLYTVTLYINRCYTLHYQ